MKPIDISVVISMFAICISIASSLSIYLRYRRAHSALHSDLIAKGAVNCNCPVCGKRLP